MPERVSKTLRIVGGGRGNIGLVTQGSGGVRAVVRDGDDDDEKKMMMMVMVMAVAVDSEALQCVKSLVKLPVA